MRHNAQRCKDIRQECKTASLASLGFETKWQRGSLAPLGMTPCLFDILARPARAPYASTMGTRLKVAVCRADVEHAPIVAEGTFEPGSDVVLGADTTCTLVVPEWEGPPIRLISGDGFLHLAEGMRVNMCGDGGASRIMGTYDELNAADPSLPIPILQRRLNVTVRKGVSVFAKYVEGSG